MTRMMLRRGVLAAVLGLCGRADGASLRFTELARLSGSLNGAAFLDTTVNLIVTTDTTLVTTVGGVQRVASLDAQIAIAGVAQVTFSAPTLVLNDGTTTRLARASDGAVILGVTNPARLSSFDLAAPPLPSVSGPATFGAGVGFETNRGLLVFTSATPQVNALFGGFASPTAVPGPSSLALCGVASLAGLIALARRRA